MMEQLLPQAILFDADGTLYDSEQLHFEAYKIVAKELYGFDFTRELFMDELVHGSKKAPQVLLEHGVSVDHDTFHNHKKRAYKTLAQKHLRPQPGMVTFLQWCRDNRIRCVIVSAATHSSLTSSLEALQIRDFFEHIVGHEDIGEQTKPHPYPYQHGLQKLGIDAVQAIAVEDTAKGIMSAQGAGLHCIGMRNGSNTTDELTAADHIIAHYQELQAYLQS